MYIFHCVRLQWFTVDHRTIVSTFVTPGWSAVRPPRSPRIPGASLASSVSSVAGVGARGVGANAVAAGALGQEGPAESTSQRTAREWLGHTTEEFRVSSVTFGTIWNATCRLVLPCNVSACRSWSLTETVQQFHTGHARTAWLRGAHASSLDEKCFIVQP